MCVNVLSTLNMDVPSEGAVLLSATFQGKVGLFLSAEGCSQMKGEKHIESRMRF